MPVNTRAKKRDQDVAMSKASKATGTIDSIIAGADSGFGAKPDPSPLLAFSEHTGCRPDRTIMVGDSSHDLMAGRSAGMGTVGVLTGVALREDLAPLSDAVLPDVTHLTAWLSV